MNSLNVNNTSAWSLEFRLGGIIRSILSLRISSFFGTAEREIATLRNVAPEMDFARPWISHHRHHRDPSPTFFFRLRDRCHSRQHMDAQPTPVPVSQADLSSEKQQRRRREWNRGPLQDLFPRIPAKALEIILDKCIDKNFVYNLSESKIWNARRYTSIVVAHVRHFYTDYDKLLREELVERYEARRQSGKQVWKVLREWCPWDADNEVLEQCFNATLLPPSQRDPTWDPMDIDDDSDGEGPYRADAIDDGDAMDLD